MNIRERNAAALVAAPFEAVHHRFERLALTYPGATAVRRGTAVLTYGELDAQADALAVALQRRGLRPGRFCALHLAPSCALVRAMLAVLKAGGAFVLQDPGLPREHTLRLARLFDPALLLTSLPAPDCGMPTVHCGDDDAALPHAWPDDYPVRPRATACAVPFRQTPHDIGIAMLTHEDLQALGDRPDAAAFSPAARAMAPLWQPLTCGAAILLAPD